MCVPCFHFCSLYTFKRFYVEEKFLMQLNNFDIHKFFILFICKVVDIAI